jgi:hypothetical protein
LSGNGQIRYRLKTPYRDVTTHVIFNRDGDPPLDFPASLAALFLRGPTPASTALDQISRGIRILDHLKASGEGPIVRIIQTGCCKFSATAPT